MLNFLLNVWKWLKFDELEGIELVEKPFEDDEMVGDSASSCDKQHGNQEDDDVGTRFVIGSHRWGRIG